MSELDAAEKLKTLIRESGKTVKEIADGAKVSRHKLWNFCNGRTATIDVRVASSVEMFLIGEARSA